MVTRRVLVDHLRKVRSAKRGSQFEDVSVVERPLEDLIADLFSAEHHPEPLSASAGSVQ